jgi:tight adherence protein C
MSGLAAVLAAVAGTLAAAGLVELAALAGARTVAPRTSAVRLLVRVGRRLGVPAAPRDLDGRLAAAGRPLGLSAGDVMAVKAAAAMLGLLLTLPLGASLPGRLSLLAPVALPAAAFVAPDMLVRRRARERGRAMEAELPDLLDLLRVALGAGLSLDRALAEVARRDRGLLARELRTAAVQVEIGVPRERALAELVARCPAPGVGALARTLSRAARHGSPLGEALGAQAREGRAARARRVTERAAKAAPQIQLVVALLLVPSVLLLVAAALLASLVG